MAAAASVAVLMMMIFKDDGKIFCRLLLLLLLVGSSRCVCVCMLVSFLLAVFRGREGERKYYHQTPILSVYWMNGVWLCQREILVLYFFFREILKESNGRAPFVPLAAERE